jgi:Spy/CpxP family protein refolding chaperone
MKHRIVIATLILCLSTLFLSMVSLSQPEDRPLPPPGGPPPPEIFLNELKNELNLSGEQVEKIQKIFDVQSEIMFESEMRSREAKHEAIEKERKAMHEKMDKQRKETDAKISALLTDEQKKKFEVLQKKQAQRSPHMLMPEADQVRPMREEYPDYQD